MKELEVVGWHYRLNRHEFEHTPEDNEAQGSLACYSPWSCKESDTTERLNIHELVEPNKKLERGSHLTVQAASPWPVTALPDLEHGSPGRSKVVRQYHLF